MDRAEHQMARLGRVDRGLKRFLIAHFADEHHVWVFADGVLHADGEVFDVLAHFALVDQALGRREDELDRVFERQNVFAILVVDVVQHRRDCGRLARPGHAGQKNQSLIEIAQSLHGRRQIEAREVGDEIIDPPRDQAQMAELRQHIDTEPPGHAVDLAHMSEIDAAFFAKHGLRRASNIGSTRRIISSAVTGSR